MDTVKDYIDFVRYCIDDNQSCPRISDWRGLFLFFKQQALLGVGFRGLEKLKSDGVGIPKDILINWYAVSEQIRKRNKDVNRRCAELTRLLKGDGFDSCILKGQGNTLLYPEPYLRMPGDIDILVVPPGRPSIRERRNIIMSYVRQRFPNTRVRYQHIDYPIYRDTEVEVHFIPTAKNNPLYNRRIQKWVEERIEEQCRNVVDLPDGVGQISIPTIEFNIIYQLSHLMHHFFDEGIGLRQMMDYYFLIHRLQTIDNVGLEEELRFLGLRKFAGAVMYVMQEVFGMKEERLLVHADERRGKLLLEEILKGGNFGQHSGLTKHSVGVKYLLKIKRNLRFAREYPAEALCEPIFRTWHFFWRLCNK